MSSSKLFLVDFAHIFCNLEFLEKEIISSLQFIDKIIKMFGFEYHWCLSLPKLGGEAFKDRVARSFCSAFEKTGITFISIEQEDRLARPMAEAWLIDSFGREWKGPTIEVDLKTSQRLKVKSRNSAGTNHSPLIVVISLFRSLERFIALLIEHFKEQIGSQITLRLCSNKAPQNSEGPQAS